MSEQKLQLNDLGENMLSEVISHLNKPKDVIHLGKTCKEFKHKIMNDSPIFWKKIFTDINIPLPEKPEQYNNALNAFFTTKENTIYYIVVELTKSNIENPAQQINSLRPNMALPPMKFPSEEEVLNSLSNKNIFTIYLNKNEAFTHVRRTEISLSRYQKFAPTIFNVLFKQNLRIQMLHNGESVTSLFVKPEQIEIVEALVDCRKIITFKPRKVLDIAKVEEPAAQKAEEHEPCATQKLLY